jgi:hypothetical protein
LPKVGLEGDDEDVVFAAAEVAGPEGVVTAMDGVCPFPLAAPDPIAIAGDAPSEAAAAAYP